MSPSILVYGGNTLGFVTGINHIDTLQYTIYPGPGLRHQIQGVTLTGMNNVCRVCFATSPFVPRPGSDGLQGSLAHKKTPTPLVPPIGP